MKFALALPLAVSLATASMSAQVTPEFVPLAPKQSVCGPIALLAQTTDASDMRMPSQRVKITLSNLSSKPIVLERYTIYFRQATPASQDRFGTETRMEVGPKQKAVFAETSSVTDPIRYVAFDSVKYADGSSWQANAGKKCRVVPGSLSH